MYDIILNVPSIRYYDRYSCRSIDIRLFCIRFGIAHPFSMILIKALKLVYQWEGIYFKVLSIRLSPGSMSPGAYLQSVHNLLFASAVLCNTGRGCQHILFRTLFYNFLTQTKSKENKIFVGISCFPKLLLQCLENI